MENIDETQNTIDKCIELLKAYKEGKTIQRLTSKDTWENVNSLKDIILTDNLYFLRKLTVITMMSVMSMRGMLHGMMPT